MEKDEFIAMNPECQRCLYFVRKKKDEVGWCRINPPTLYFSSDDDIFNEPYAFFPKVFLDWWCGKFVSGKHTDPDLDKEFTYEELLQMVIDSPYLMILPNAHSKFEPLKKKILEKLGLDETEG